MTPPAVLVSRSGDAAVSRRLPTRAHSSVQVGLGILTLGLVFIGIAEYNGSAESSHDQLVGSLLTVAAQVLHVLPDDRVLQHALDSTC